ncbi:cellulase family glycosylhydrolase [Tenacibaculum geojense]|uniref:Cellulase family glycosylhydrolase n=1 Tax=Tenacibaculum geojense TaxID=915352 RepID=A0ABW3JPX5_9FLAO
MKKILFIYTLFLSTLINSQNCDTTPVAKHGSLSVSGNKIVNKNNEPVSFAGNSFFWSNNGWGGEKYYKAEVVSWLKNDWNTSLVRAAMGVEDNGGYIGNPTDNKNKVKTVVDTAINEGLYVIIDWHSHHAENYQQQAIDFFKEMATLYGNHPNVIYEIYNEPLQVSWDSTIKPYAEAVIDEIRKIDPDNLIIVGTPTWSQDVDAAARNPITGYSNIAYTLHFYAATHKESLRQKAEYALNQGIALMVTEWGAVSANGDGAVDVNSTDTWMNFLATNHITHANWAMNDKSEGASSLRPGASVNGNWSASNLTASGQKVKNIIQNWATYCNGDNGGGDNGGGDNGGGDQITYDINIKARGVLGGEQLSVYINNSLIDTFTLTSTYEIYGVDGNGEVKLEFINDNGDRDVQIDYITINNNTLQAEDQEINTGVWQNNTCGGSYSEWLNCNGYIVFGADNGNNPDPNGCNGIPAWDANTVYDAKDTQVVFNNVIYSNNWYSKNQNPENNSGQWEVWSIVGPCTNQRVNTSDVKIYSNNAYSALTINSKTTFNKVEIFTIDGRKLIDKNLSKYNQNIDIANLKNGFYIIKLTGDSVVTKKIAIKH